MTQFKFFNKNIESHITTYRGYVDMVKYAIKNIPRFEHNHIFYRKFFMENGIQKLFRISSVKYHPNVVEIKIGITYVENEIVQADSRQYVFSTQTFNRIIEDESI